MAKEEKEKKETAPKMPETTANPPPAKSEPPAKSPPSSSVKYALAALVIIIIAGAAYLYFQQSGEKELSISDFRARLGVMQRTAVVQDLRGIPAGDSNASGALMNCAIQLSYALSLLGKNVTNYAYEGETCMGGSSASASRTPNNCDDEIKGENRMMFVISYNSASNRTRLFQGRAVFSGDRNFLSDCSISTIPR